jgi:hypothetical protein
MMIKEKLKRILIECRRAVMPGYVLGPTVLIELAIDVEIAAHM